MEPLKLPKAYPGNKYEQRITIAGIVDPSSVTAVLRRGKGGQKNSEQFEVTTAPTPGARSTDVTVCREEGFSGVATLYLEISADGQVVRAGIISITYDTN